MQSNAEFVELQQKSKLAANGMVLQLELFGLMVEKRFIFSPP